MRTELAWSLALRADFGAHLQCLLDRPGAGGGKLAEHAVLDVDTIAKGEVSLQGRLQLGLDRVREVWGSLKDDEKRANT